LIHINEIKASSRPLIHINEINVIFGKLLSGVSSFRVRSFLKLIEEDVMRKSLFRRLAGSRHWFFNLARIIEVTAETAVGAKIGSRLLSAFKASPNQVEQQLIERWKGIGVPQGALKESDFLMVLEDRLLTRDSSSDYFV
jgi:hypothetical protein